MSKPARSRKRHLVVALAYDGLCTFEFGCAVELFALERPELDVPWYDFIVCSIDGELLRAAGGIEVRVPNTIALLDQADTIVIPGHRRRCCARSAVHISEAHASARSARVCSCWQLPEFSMAR
jgi:AraC family transcriptional regulator, transcriptional activator FtrA